MGTSVYQVYPRSFQDTNGDGKGDLHGVISRLDYIKDAGFETIWLSPFFKSPQHDFGYDVEDYFSADPDYGTDEDIDLLIAETHRRNMYIVFDMVLNHTSDRHPWFLESRSSKDNPKRDWYVWKDGRKGLGGKRLPPNNWKSQVSGTGWHYDEKTEQWYWAAFLPFQPDLNYRNPEVKTAVFKMLEYWLEKGVNGFRLDIIGAIFEDEEFRDSPFTWKLLPDENNEGMLFQSTCRTQNLPESIEFSRELRALTDRFDNPPRFLVGETFGRPETISRFCRDRGLHAAFAFKCAAVPFTAAAFRRLIEEYEDCFAAPLVPAWAFSNHDRTRRISALGGDAEKAKLNAAFQITARGIPFFYFGEELGMKDAVLPHKESLDPVSFAFRNLPAPVFKMINRMVHGSLNRDCVRTPMQWKDEENAGFCPPGVTPWLPVNPDTGSINAASADRDPDSILKVFRRFLVLRAGSRALRFGRVLLIGASKLPQGILGFYRITDDERNPTEKLLVLLNFKSRETEIALELLEISDVKELKLIVSTKVDRPEPDGSILKLKAYECVVFECLSAANRT